MQHRFDVVPRLDLGGYSVGYGGDKLGSNFTDLALLRSDGTPTYMLAVVVDDHDMGVTQIIRGDDHLTNAARQSQIYRALGWDVPDELPAADLIPVYRARLPSTHH